MRENVQSLAPLVQWRVYGHAATRVIVHYHVAALASGCHVIRSALTYSSAATSALLFVVKCALPFNCVASSVLQTKDETWKWSILVSLLSSHYITPSSSHLLCIIEMKTLGENDPNEDPLLSLACGHVFTVSTLDNIVNLEEAYNKNEEGQWDSIRQLPPKCGAVPQCPKCRSPISNIRRYPILLFLLFTALHCFCPSFFCFEDFFFFFYLSRYGRILSQLALEQASIKFRLKIEGESRSVTKVMEGFATDLIEMEQSDIDSNNVRRFRDMKRMIDDLVLQSSNNCESVNRDLPERSVYEKAVSILRSRSIDIH